jgi:hypothetical protein
VTPAPRADAVKAIEARRAQQSGAPLSQKSAAKPADEGGPQKAPATAGGDLKDGLLEEIRKQKKFFYGTVVAQAQRVDLDGDAIVFVFGSQHRALRTQLEQNRPWLEETASGLAGRRIGVVSREGAPSAENVRPSAANEPAERSGAQGAVPTSDTRAESEGRSPSVQKEALKQRALSDTGVQTMLDVFAAEIKDVEEM